MGLSYIADNVRKARSQGDTWDGVRAWRELLGLTHVDEADYSDWARELAGLYRRMQRGLSAARIHEYLLDIEAAQGLYASHGTARDEARVLYFGNQLAAACERYRAGSLFAHAARAAEEGGRLDVASGLYEQLQRSHEATGHPYLSGLAALNAGRLAMDRDRSRGVALLAVATRLLEQEADAREHAGDRSGAMKCYQCLIEIGRVEGSYENLAEGYLNCIRLLKGKADRFFTMQYYKDFICASDELGELHSVADLYREAGEYARRVGFIYANHFLEEAGNAWLRVADEGLGVGAPTELLENALLAAVGCFNRIQSDQRVAEVYHRLAELPLQGSRQERYAALADELTPQHGGKSEAPTALPDYFRRRLGLPPVWHRDLLEAEAGRDIHDAIGRLVGDHKNVWEVQRRKAMLLALQYDDHLASGGVPESVPALIIEALGELGHPAAVRPLEAIYEHGDETVRALVIEKAVNLKRKEAFSLIERGLEDGRERVVEAITSGIRRMTFPQALDSLARLHNAYEQGVVKEACLRSIAAIGTDEACEFLLDIIRSSSGAAALRARNLLERHAQERMLSSLERNRRQEPDPSLRLFIGKLVDQVRAKRGNASL